MLNIGKTNIVKINLTNILTLETVYCSYNQEVIVNVGVTKRMYNKSNGRIDNYRSPIHLDENGNRIDERGRRLDRNGYLIQ